MPRSFALNTISSGRTVDLDLSYYACEIAFASALHLKPQPQSNYGCLGLINYSKTPLQPEVLPHSTLPVAGDKD